MKDLYHPQPEPYETLLIRRDGAIDWLTLNRPEALNALSIRMQLELQHYFETLYRQWDTRVVILRGAGRAYCAGLDIKEVDLSTDIANPVLGLRVQQGGAYRARHLSGPRHDRRRGREEAGGVWGGDFAGVGGGGVREYLGRYGHSNECRFICRGSHCDVSFGLVKSGSPTAMPSASGIARVSVLREAGSDRAN